MSCEAPQWLTVAISACLATRVQKALMSTFHVAIEPLGQPLKLTCC